MKLLYVIGNPVSHSLSPMMHNAALSELDMSYDYLYSSLEVNDLERVYNLLRKESTCGASITIPFKESVFKYFDKNNISTHAKKIGAINTIYKKNNMLYGANTDWSGFLQSIRNHISLGALKNEEALIIGSGGVAKAFIYGLKSIGMNITILSRSKKEVSEISPNDTKNIKVINKIDSTDNFSLIVNATPLGMKGNYKNETPINKKYITEKHICIDAIYTPIKTRFLKEADKKGAKTINGLDQLVYQGAEAFKLWTGKEAPIDVMKQVCLDNL